MDNFKRRLPNLESPGTNGEQVQPSVKEELDRVSRALYIGNGGDVKVEMRGEEITFVNVADSTLLPIRVSKVFDSGTTATDIVAID